MKNNLKKPLISLIIIFLSLIDMAQAGNSVSISVSCNVPAVAGLNTPSVEETALMAPATESEHRIEIKKEEVSTQDSTMTQEDTQKEKTTDDDNEPMVLIKTVYSR